MIKSKAKNLGEEGKNIINYVLNNQNKKGKENDAIDLKLKSAREQQANNVSNVHHIQQYKNYIASFLIDLLWTKC